MAANSRQIASSDVTGALGFTPLSGLSGVDASMATVIATGSGTPQTLATLAATVALASVNAANAVSQAATAQTLATSLTTSVTAASTAAAAAQAYAAGLASQTDAAVASVITTTLNYNIPGDFPSVVAAMASLVTTAPGWGARVNLNMGAQRTTLAANINAGYEGINFLAVNITGATPILLVITSGPTNAAGATGWDGTSGAWTATYGVSINPLAAGILAGDYIALDEHIPANEGSWQIIALTTNSITVELTHVGTPDISPATGCYCIYNPTQLTFPASRALVINEGGKLGAVTNLAINGTADAGIYIAPGGYLSANQAYGAPTPTLQIAGFGNGLWCQGASDVSVMASSNGVQGNGAIMTGTYVLNGGGGAYFDGCWVSSPWFVACGCYLPLECTNIVDISLSDGLIGGGPYQSVWCVTGGGNVAIPTFWQPSTDYSIPPVNTVGGTNGVFYVHQF